MVELPESTGPERIQKILSRVGIASRRKAESLIEEGRVARNGFTVKLGDRATAGVDSITVDGIRVETDAPLRYFMLNKPEGVVSTARDPGGRPTVLDLIEDTPDKNVRLFPVGRLDMDSRGLILLTNDGLLSNRLMHPSFKVKREYLVDIRPALRPGDLAVLRKGVKLEDGVTAPAKVSTLAKTPDGAQIKMVIHTGKKRQIKRSLKALGYDVISLVRTRIGPQVLGNLEEGKSRELKAGEVKALYDVTGWK